MQFNSVAYIAFLLVVVVTYYMAARTYSHQRLLILIASAFFYAFWSAIFLAHLVGVLLFNYCVSVYILSAASQSAKRRLLALGITVDLANLFVFKYAGLAVATSNGLMELFGWSDLLLPKITVFLPLAISFYTFSVISYLVDIYRDQQIRASGPLDFLFYAMFFPHLIAGPILRKHEFFPQCENKTLVWENIRYGTERILIGLFQKAVIADNLAIIVDHGYSKYAALSVAEMYVVLVAYSFQIFFDFAGYSAIAIGSARLFGYVFPENFNTPYVGANISDFWRRWHMTLSRWIRDYIYIPLGGSRGSKRSAHVNVLVTMGLAGLWHGASWNFAVWGLYHGAGLVIHHWFEESNLRRVICQSLPSALYNGIMVLLTFHIVTFGWVLFRAHDFSTAWGIYEKFGEWGLSALSLNPAYVLKSYGFTSLLLYGLYVLLRRQPAIRVVVAEIPRRRVMVYGIALALILVLAPLHTDPFIYFRF